MKHLLHTFLVFIAFNALAQDYVDGLILTNLNDTIKCSILKHKSKKDERGKSFKLISIKDSLGNTKEFFPKDIRGYYKEKSWYKSLIQQIFLALLSKLYQVRQNSLRANPVTYQVIISGNILPGNY